MNLGMSLRKSMFCLIILLWLALCGTGNASSEVVNADWFSKERLYMRLVSPFETEQECQDYRKKRNQVLFNCHQLIYFFPDGRAGVLFSGDIMNAATYSVEGMFISIKPMSGGRFDPLGFYISDDYKSLIEDGSSEVWLINER